MLFIGLGRSPCDCINCTLGGIPGMNGMAGLVDTFISQRQQASDTQANSGTYCEDCDIYHDGPVARHEKFFCDQCEKYLDGNSAYPNQPDAVRKFCDYCGYNTQ